MDQIAEPASSATASMFVNITPSPRILKILGNIEFEPWQCIAELADNSFDEFLNIKRSNVAWTEAVEVGIVLPPQTQLRHEAVIEVRDNGRGMTIEQVTDAARAGWTSNDPFSKLGLFGMGFNVATARLGRVTRILSTRSGDADWVGIEVDLDKIGSDFAAPVIREAKLSPGEHGSRVEVSGLDPRADWLRRTNNQKRLRETLGAVYSYLLDKEGFRLTVNSVQVKPVRHCAWSDSRSVIRDGKTIPAIMPIDFRLEDLAACHACGNWQDPDNDRCDECGDGRLEIRERRIWGWLGIRRNLDDREFGIDFLRNGRKILRFDKSLFDWRDPDDPSDQGSTEYPTEVPAGQGRIIGEIHLDHVPVIYTKDSFDTSDKNWRTAVRRLRGDAPLKPDTARRLGLTNDSPLEKLFKGYRRNDPGTNYLMPGNGKQRIDTKEWEKLFKEGNPDYLDDTKWWAAVVRHDELQKEAKRAREEKERGSVRELDDPTTEFQESQPTPQQLAAPKRNPAAPQTERDRLAALVAAGTVLTELDGQFVADGLPGRPVQLKTYEVARLPVTTPDGTRVPVLLTQQVAPAYVAFVDTAHPHFQLFADDPADLVLVELAQHLIIRATGPTPPISKVFAGLKGRYLASRSIDLPKLIGLASQTMNDLKERMEGCISENPERPWQNTLNQMERRATEDRIIEALKTADIDAVILEGRYLRFVPDGVIPRIIEEWPEPFFDDQLFRGPYRVVSSPSARRQTVATVTSFLNDIAWLAQGPPSGTRDQLVRARLSLQLLPDELVEIQE